MGTVRKLSEFFANSPKRQQHLVEKIKSLLPHSNHQVLIDVCRARWISRIDGLDRVVELCIPIVATLEDIQLNRGIDDSPANWNSSSRDDAQALANAINFPFLVSLIIVRYILGLTRSATVKLQREEMDILKAELEIYSLKHALQVFQTNIDEEHPKLFSEAVWLGREIGVELSRPRVVQN